MYKPTEIDLYYSKYHVLCPKCKNDHIVQTVRLVTCKKKYVDKTNTALCKKCGWSGVVDDLKPEEK